MIMDIMSFTFGMLKPDAVEAKRIGDIIRRIELAGLDLDWMELRRVSIQEAEELYKEHLGRPYYHKLIKFTISGPVVLMKLRYGGDREAFKAWRLLLGDTDPKKAAPGTIRHDYGNQAELPFNIAHGSDSEDAAKRELRLFCT